VYVYVLFLCLCFWVGGFRERADVVTPVPGIYCKDVGESEALIAVWGVEGYYPVFGVEGADMEG
jgi:hypothetical protein